MSSARLEGQCQYAEPLVVPRAAAIGSIATASGPPAASAVSAPSTQSFAVSCRLPVVITVRYRMYDIR